MEGEKVEKERKVKTLSLVALIVAVLGLTVAFAALSQTLTINGTESVNAATWDIRFENLEKEIQGDASFNSEPVLDATSISNIDVTLTKPEDQAYILINISNKGTVNAKISSIDISKLCTLSSPVEACDWDNDGTVTQSDINKIDDNLSFIMAYTEGDEGGHTLKVNDVLNAGESKQIVVYIMYAKAVEENGSYTGNDSYVEATELPKRDLQFKDLSIKINYVQND